MEEKTKPTVKLIGEDGNIFNLLGIVNRELRKQGLAEKGKELTEKVMKEAKSYGEALNLISEYVEIE